MRGLDLSLPVCLERVTTESGLLQALFSGNALAHFGRATAQQDLTSPRAQLAVAAYAYVAGIAGLTAISCDDSRTLFEDSAHQ